MTIRARGKKFLATVNHRGQRHRRTFASSDEASIWSMKTKVELSEGKTIKGFNTPQSPALPHTLKELAKYTKTHEWSNRKSGVELYRNAEMVCEVLGGDTPIADVTKLHIDDMIQQWKSKGSQNGTINRKLASLSKLLSMAMELEVISKRPIIKRLPESGHRVRWYNYDEFKKMEHFCNIYSSSDTRWIYFKHYIKFMADTGLRQSEAYRLKWSDIIDIKTAYSTDPSSSEVQEVKGVLVKETKNDERRVIPLTFKAQEILKHIRSPDSDFMELTESGPWVWFTKTRLRSYWSYLRNAMGWKDDKQAVLHTLRHTFCSRLVQKGIPLAMVRELAGHKRLEMTLRYSHLSPHDLITSVDVLNKEDEVRWSARGWENKEDGVSD